MPRGARKHSESGHYHVILRGVNRLEIYHDDEDRARFLDTLLRFAREDGIGIVAYCLMDNHVHLLLNAGDNLSVFITSTGNTIASAICSRSATGARPWKRTNTC